MTPKVSVIMPAYNSYRYIDTAIQSILNQTYDNFEFIIIDDFSTDGTWEIVKQYAAKDRRIVAIRNKKNIRVTKTLNKGLFVATGKYIIRMDADDWSYPNRIVKQVKFMEQHPEVGVSGGSIEVCNARFKTLNVRSYPLTDNAVRKIIFRYSPFAHPATIWRKNLLIEVKGYNENIPLSQDYELYFRIGKICKFANLADVLIKLRTHNDSSSIIKGRYQEQYAIYSRIKAFLEFEYTMTFFDKVYTFLQIGSMVIVPPKLKFWLFNWLRRKT